MGADPEAVVDSEGRMNAVRGMRVVDASIMPKVITGNLNAPVMMMAEKIADRIVGRTPLAPSDAVYYRAARVSEGGQGSARGRDPDALRRATRPSGEAHA